MTPTVLVATWHDGLFLFQGESRRQEHAGEPIRSLASDGRGGVLAIVNGHSLSRRASNGEWSTIATSRFELACAVAVGDGIYAGTGDARILHVNANGTISQLIGFDAVPGRDKWYAGSARINGRVVGPPLGVRSITATSDGQVLLANVHVGGIPRSTDGGVTWQPTIDIDNDVHEVCAHATRPNIVTAAAAVGLCISRDGGVTWAVEQDGLHAAYCSAVAFSGNNILVSASENHFAAQGGIYRRPIDQQGPLVPLGAGLPRWIDGIADTACIATGDSVLAVADKAGNLYMSVDTGRTWSRRADSLPTPSGVLVV